MEATTTTGKRAEQSEPRLLFAGPLWSKRSVFGVWTAVYVHLYPYRWCVYTSMNGKDGSDLARPTSDLLTEIDLHRLSSVSIACNDAQKPFQFVLGLEGKKHSTYLARDAASFVSWMERLKMYVFDEQVRAVLDERRLLSSSEDAIDISDGKMEWCLVDLRDHGASSARVTTAKLSREEGDADWELLSTSQPASLASQAEGKIDVPRLDSDIVEQAIDSREKPTSLSLQVRIIFHGRNCVISSTVRNNINSAKAIISAKTLKKFFRGANNLPLDDVRGAIIRLFLFKSGRSDGSVDNAEWSAVRESYLRLHASWFCSVFLEKNVNGKRHVIVPRNFATALPKVSDLPYEWALDTNELLLNSAAHRLSCQCLCALTVVKWPQVRFNPYLIDVIVLLRAFLSECEVWIVLNLLIGQQLENSPNDHFTLAEHGFFAMSETFVRYANAVCKKIVVRLQECKMDLKQLFEEWCRDFFGSLFNSWGRLRVLLCFLCEGSKIFVRVGVGILKSLEGPLLSCTSRKGVQRILRELAALDIDSVLQAGFAVQLQRKGIAKSKRSAVVELKQRMFHGESLHEIAPDAAVASYSYTLPHIPDQKSALLTVEGWFFVWAGLPVALRSSFPRRAFFSGEHGYSGKALCSAVGDRSCLVLAKTGSGDVVGVFLSHSMLEKHAHDFGMSYLLRFDLNSCEGRTFRVAASGIEGQLMGYCRMLQEDGCLCVGGSSGVALQLDYKLKEGMSGACREFQGMSAPLTQTIPEEGGTFDIEDVEVWFFEEGGQDF